jgi:hypothetical protein
VIRTIACRFAKVAAAVALAFGVLVFAVPAGSAFAHGTTKGGGTTKSGTTNCALTNSGVGADVWLTGSGYKPGVTYGISFTVNGAALGLTSSMANAEGQISQATWAHIAGTYVAQVYSGRTYFATCSTVVS